MNIVKIYNQFNQLHVILIDQNYQYSVVITD